MVLFDPRAPWEKPCGGGLTAAALRHTPELWELAPDGCLGRELLVVSPAGRSVAVPLRSPILVVSRTALARWGLERARAAGARFVGAAVRAVERLGAEWRLEDARGRTYRAHRLVAADGASSRLRARLAPNFQPELAPTRVAYPRQGVEGGRLFIRFLRRADGYLWDFPRRDHHSVGVAVPPHTYTREALDGVIAQYRLGERGDDTAAHVTGAVIATANWIRGRFEELGTETYALLGDAAGLADPATGEGIDYALRSATLAASAYDERHGFATYPAAAREAFAPEFRRALLVRRWLYTPTVAEGLVRWACGSARGHRLLASLVDAVNEHGSLRRAVLRALSARDGDRAARLALGQNAGAAAGAYPPAGGSNAAEMRAARRGRRSA